ncbi:hypothetical protein VTI74DRAFT_7521 [Chaetomium olivicolor]
MTGPRTKRQFAGAASDPTQRQITSFFSKTSSTPGHAASAAAKQSALNGPELPPQVQTDLLTVGMRIRKAIPEGYKTGSEYSAFTLWAEDNNTTSNSHPSSTTPSAAFTSSMRELEPFCGLNKVGGLAFQPSYNAIDDAIDYTAMPGLTSSQDSVLSTSSCSSSSFSANIPTITTTTPAGTFTTALPTRKRSFLPEEDEVAHDALSASLPYQGPFRLSTAPQQREGGWLDDEISPCTLAPPAGVWENARVLAVPRRARQNKRAVEEAMRGEENAIIVVPPGQDGNDFEEASFLDYSGLSGDTEMRG